MNTKIEVQPVRFKKKWFNPLYFIILALMKEGVTEFYLFGGKSSSKTITACQIIAKGSLLEKTDSLIFRKESINIKTTAKPSMQKAIESMRLDDGYKKMDFSFKTAFGNDIFFKGLDSDEKVKGIEGFGYVLFDELNQFTKDEYDQAILSFRGEKARAFFGTWNPVSDTSWIKTDLIDKDEWYDTEHKLPSKYSFVKKNRQGNRALIKTTYWDNYWTVGSPCGTYGFYDAALIAKYERLKEFDEDQYNINVLGDWGTIKADTPYLLHLKRNVNGGTTKLNQRAGVLMSFDFNVKNTVLIWQMWRDHTGWRVQCLREIRMGGSEEEDLEAICRILARDYGDREIIFTGDASGNNASATSKGNKAAFGLIYDYLRGHGARFVTYHKIRANPRTRLSRFVTNAITKELGPNFQIDDNCKELWADIVRVPCDVHGDLDKKYCEKQDIGHAIDALRYFTLVFCYDIWLEIREKIAVPKELDMLDNRVEQDAYRNAA